MPSSPQSKSVVSPAGAGKPGYCVLCSVRDPVLQDELDKRFNARNGNGGNAYSWTKLNEWMESKGIKIVARATIDKHRKHVLHPQDRVVNAIARRTSEHGVQPAATSHEDFLASLVSIGAMRISENPEDVTIDQALKAANIQVQREKKGQTNVVLVNLFTAPPPDGDIIEGEVREA